MQILNTNNVNWTKVVSGVVIVLAVAYIAIVLKMVL